MNTKFDEFDPAAELWSDIPQDRRAESFITNKSSVVYKLIMNLAQQQTPPRDINSLSMAEMAAHMAEDFNPKRFVVR